MKYRIQADLIFADQQAAEDVYQWLRDDVLPACVSFQVTTAEKTRTELHECRHDENPPGPCSVLDRREVEIGEGGKVMPIITSNPPVGKCKVVNIYVDPTTGKVVVKYDDTPKPP